jgi:hypothetical protein
MGAFAEFERALILERQREGIAAAKQRGAYTGRKPALTDEQARQLRERAAAGERKSALAKEFGISRAAPPPGTSAARPDRSPAGSHRAARQGTGSPGRRTTTLPSSATQPQAGVRGGVGLGDVVGTEVGPVRGLCRCPHQFHRVEVVGVAGQLLHPQPVSLGGQPCLHVGRPMRGQAVPDQGDHRQAVTCCGEALAHFAAAGPAGAGDLADRPAGYNAAAMAERMAPAGGCWPAWSGYAPVTGRGGSARPASGRSGHTSTR